MSRTWVITRHTFRETIVQPIYPLLVVLGVAVIALYSQLPFFTLGEDVLMYKSVGLDVVLLLALLVSLFAASRSIYEEIEDRTMLTLMSKPVARWQVLLGKFLGILLGAGLAVAVMGAVLAVGLWLRVPGDYNLQVRTIDELVVERIGELRALHLAGLWPQLVLLWMQVGVLVSISIAISTRFSLVVNLPATLLVYLGGNLTRFIDAAADGEGALVVAGAFLLNSVLPFLAVFDLTDLTVFGVIALPGTTFADDPLATTRTALWTYVAVAGVYFAGYVTFILTLGYISLRSRDLGGAEG